MHNFPGLIWLIWVPILFGLDQWSKWVVIKTVSLGESVTLLPNLQVTLAHNTGVAFSLLSNQTSLIQKILVFVVGLITLTIAIWLVKTPRTDKWSGCALVLILGGALGNLCDRILQGSVIDFIDFHIRSWHWYTFNLADAFITIGALMLIKSLLFSAHESGEKR